MRYLGIPYVYAGADPSGFDCSASPCTSTPRSGSRCRTTPPCSSAWAPGRVRPTHARHDRLLLRPRTRRDVHRRRQLHPPRTPATWSRSQRSPGITPPSSTGRGATPNSGLSHFVEPFDLGCEVLLDDTSLQLHGQGHLALLRREVARDNCEPLDLLEARPVAVDVVDDALDGRLCLLARDPVRLVLVERDERDDVRRRRSRSRAPARRPSTT